MSFLAIVTTSRVAAGVAHHDGRGARLAAREGLVLSLVVGCAMAAVGEFGGAAATLKSVYVTGRTAAILAPATTYCRIRGVALPLQLAWQTAQVGGPARHPIVSFRTLHVTAAASPRPASTGKIVNDPYLRTIGGRRTRLAG